MNYLFYSSNSVFFKSGKYQKRERIRSNLFIDIVSFERSESLVSKIIISSPVRLP